jgi:hypothetical protein
MKDPILLTITFDDDVSLDKDKYGDVKVKALFYHKIVLALHYSNQPKCNFKDAVHSDYEDSLKKEDNVLQMVFKDGTYGSYDDILWAIFNRFKATNEALSPVQNITAQSFLEKMLSPETRDSFKGLLDVI